MRDRIRLSPHAALRTAQRGISRQDIDYVLMHGEWRGKSGRQEVFLSRRHIPPEDLAGYGHLAGILVVIDDKGKWAITTYKQRALESYQRRPYARVRDPWRSLLAESPLR